MERIVVGVDGSPGSEAALRWAVKLAHETGARLDAVAAWELTYGWIDGYWPDIQRWSKEAAAAAAEMLDKTIAAATHDSPESLEPIRTVVEGPPAQVLLARSTGADLLVVGSRGRGGFVGLLLGSVSQQCVHYATVPVAVVPQPD